MEQEIFMWNIFVYKKITKQFAMFSYKAGYMSLKLDLMITIWLEQFVEYVKTLINE